MDFFKSPVFYALLGTLVGSFSTFFFQYILKSREMSLRLREKNLDMRFQAYHELIKELKVFDREDFHPNFLNKDGGALSYPKVFESVDSFDHHFDQLIEIWHNSEHLFPADVYEAFYRIEMYLHHVRRSAREGRDGVLMPLFGHWISIELMDYIDDCVDILDIHLEEMTKNPRKSPKWHPLPEEKVNYEIIAAKSVMETKPEEYIELLNANGLEIRTE